MSNYISEQNKNDKRDLEDLEWINELYQYLQNKDLDQSTGIISKSGIELSPEKAFRVIWFLQEHLRVLPDNIEKCDSCGDLYDADQGGHHTDEPYNGIHNFCNSCEEQLPDKYYN